MKKTITLIILVLTCAGVLHSSYWSDSSVIDNSLGGAVNLLNPDVSMTFSDPSLIGLCDRSHFTGSYYMLYGARYNFLGYMEKMDNSGFSISAVNFYRENIEVRQNLNDIPQYTYNNQIFANLAYGTKLGGFNVGAAGKYAFYDIYNRTNSGYGIDVGINRKIFESGSLINHYLYSYADFSIVNLLQPKITLINDSETLPRLFRLGLNINYTLCPSYDIKNEKFKYQNIGIFIDNNYDTNYFINSGIEYSMSPIAIRIGHNDSGFTCGFGLNINDLSFNYAFLQRQAAMHYVDLTYKYGDSTILAETPKELDEYKSVLNQAQRVYDRYINMSNSLINDKKYEEALVILNKIKPISVGLKSNGSVNDMIKLCIMSINTTIIVSLNNEFNGYINKQDYSNACNTAIKAVDLDYSNNITITMFKTLNDQKTELIEKQNINENITAYISKTNETIDKYLSKNDYDNANTEYNKLKTLQLNGENTITQFKKINDEKSKYSDRLVKKAMEYKNKNDYGLAYLCYREAYRVTKDANILEQSNKLKNLYLYLNNYNLPEKLYQQKIYYLSSISLANSESNTTEYFVDLKRHNVTYDYDILENTLIEQGKIERYIP